MSMSRPRGFASRREISGEIAARIDAAVRAGHLPAQDTALAATALLGALHEALVGPLAPDNMDDQAKLRDAVQTVTLLALRAVGQWTPAPAASWCRRCCRPRRWWAFKDRGAKLRLSTWD